MNFKDKYGISNDICIASYKDSLICMNVQDRLLFILNKSAREIFALFKKGRSLESIKAHFVGSFNIADRARANRDFINFIKKAQKRRLIRLIKGRGKS